MRDITATLVHLATRGYLAIHEKNDPSLFGLLPGEEFVFQSLKPVAEWSNLAAHERA